MASLLKNKTVVRVLIAILVVVAVLCVVKALGGGKCECRAKVTPSPSAASLESLAPLTFMGGNAGSGFYASGEPVGIEAWRADDEEEEADAEEAFEGAYDEDEAEEEAFRSADEEVAEDEEEAFIGHRGMDSSDVDVAQESFTEFSGVQFTSDLLS